MPKPVVIPPTADPHILGIFPSDIIIRGALTIGLNELRDPQNRWVLEKTFTNQTLDTETNFKYGLEDQQKAIKWFLETNIPIFFGQVRADDFRIPSITIELLESAEDFATLGEVDNVPWEDIPAPSNPQIFGTFTPLSYVQSTGTVTLPPSQVGVLPFFEGMVLVQQDGVSWPIINVLNGFSFQIPVNSPANLTQCTLQANTKVTNSYSTLARSVLFKETYRIGVHVNSEPAHLTYLHDIVKMVLLRNRKRLLEKRGFDRAAISSSDFAKNFDLVGEVAFSRFITMVGYVKTSWPGEKDLRSQGLILNTINEEPTVEDVENAIFDGFDYQNT
jgi:hypothetical protein